MTDVHAHAYHLMVMDLSQILDFSWAFLKSHLADQQPVLSDQTDDKDKWVVKYREKNRIKNKCKVIWNFYKKHFNSELLVPFEELVK